MTEKFNGDLKKIEHPLRVAVLGASRGLGRSFCERMAMDSRPTQLLLSSRKEKLLEDLKESLLVQHQSFAHGEGECAIEIEICAADFSREEGQQKVLAALDVFRPQRIFYFSGGGPFGFYEHKEWKDHWWALQVTFLFAARVVHWAMQNHLVQAVLIGSSICESKGDPQAASYCAAKHGLVGLYQSIRLENPEFDLRLFSPGYLDTQLLPVHASPRQSMPISSPIEVADVLWNWTQVETSKSHFVFS